MTQLVAILNVTPDSFSDGGIGDYAARAAQATTDGASVIDIGAESTRPGATPVTPQEEWARLEPVLQSIPKTVPLSLDTRHPETLTKAIPFGVRWLNDVGGLQDERLVAVAREAGLTMVLMHSLTVPADKNVTLPADCDVITTLIEWAKPRIDTLKSEKLIFDPGLGFGKTVAQSWRIIEEAERFKALGVPILIGHSRKSFLNLPMEERDAATATISRKLAAKGIDYLRVHNVPLNAAAITA